MKKTLALILTLVIIMATVPFGIISVSAATASGQTGDCTWTLNGTTLTISGNGDMGEGMRWDSNITTAVIEEGVTSIGAYAFYGCNKLENVTIAESVTEICDMAFSECIGLANITIPKGVKTIGNGVFAGCISLQGITILNKSLSIGNDAFYNCSSLKKVVYSGNEADRTSMSIGFNNESLTNIDWTYGTCSEHIYDNDCDNSCNNCGTIRETSHKYDDENDTDCNVCGDNHRFTVYGTTGDCSWGFYNGVLTIYGNGAMGNESPWWGNEITKIVIEEGVTSIGMYAFTDCYFAEEVIIPNSVITIGEGAFYCCRSLTEIVLPEGVTKIPNDAFFDCRKLEMLVIKGKVTSIGTDAFENDYKLKNVYFAGSEKDYILMDIAVGNAPILMINWVYDFKGEVNTIPHEHDFGDWKIVTKATTEVDGLKIKECDCGEIITKTIPRKLTFASKTLGLKSNIALIFRVDPVYLTNHGYTNLSVVFNFNNKEYVVTDYTVNTNGLYEYRFSDAGPHQMLDNVTAVIKAEFEGEVYTSEPLVYSIATYCYTQINALQSYPQMANLVSLLVDMLNYGAAAQQFNSYNTSNLANASLTESQLAFGNQDVLSYEDMKDMQYATVENSVATFNTVALAIKDSIAVSFKFTMAAGQSIDGLVVRFEAAGKSWDIPESEFTYESANNRYVATIREINPSQMKERILATLYKDGAIVSDTASYSIESYGASTAMSIPTVKTLVEAMVRYGRSAKAYNG